QAVDAHGISLTDPRVHVTDVNAPEDLTCPNPRCITNSELTLKRKFYKADSVRQEYRCMYCDEEAETK
ncbi:aspartate carbamoyltransferase, partial [Bifidobacteriaceae bacterium VN003]